MCVRLVLTVLIWTFHFKTKGKSFDINKQQTTKTVKLFWSSKAVYFYWPKIYLYYELLKADVCLQTSKRQFPVKMAFNWSILGPYWLLITQKQFHSSTNFLKPFLTHSGSYLFYFYKYRCKRFSPQEKSNIYCFLVSIEYKHKSHWVRE